jgi:hypothetical protein
MVCHIPHVTDRDGDNFLDVKHHHFLVLSLPHDRILNLASTHCESRDGREGEGTVQYLLVGTKSNATRDHVLLMGFIA